MGKDKIYLNILRTVLRLEIQKGHLKWSLSEVSKISGVTRSLIYYYFGKNKHEIMQEATSYLGKEIFSLDMSPTSALPINERLKILTEVLRDNPYLFLHFYINKCKDNETGENIRSIEDRFLVKLKGEFPNLSEEQRLLIYVIELGILAYQKADAHFIDWIKEYVSDMFQHTVP